MCSRPLPVSLDEGHLDVLNEIGHLGAMAYQALEPPDGPSSSKRPMVTFAQTKIIFNYIAAQRIRPRNEQHSVVDPAIAAEAAATTTVDDASLAGITNSSTSQSSDSHLHNVNASTQVNTLDSTKPINPLQATSRFPTGVPTGTYALTSSVNEGESIEVVDIDWAEEESKPDIRLKNPLYREERRHLKIPDYDKTLRRPAARPVEESVQPSFTQADQSPSSGRSVEGEKQGNSAGNEIKRVSPQEYVPPWNPERVLERIEASRILLTKIVSCHHAFLNPSLSHH